MIPAVVTARQRNRAILARQLLLDRAELDVAAALERVAGLQTQYAPSAYVGLWSRLRGFARPMLTDALVVTLLLGGARFADGVYVPAAEEVSAA